MERNPDLNTPLSYHQLRIVEIVKNRVTNTRAVAHILSFKCILSHSLCVFVYVCVYVYVCLCVCVFMCVCVCVFPLSLLTTL